MPKDVVEPTGQSQYALDGGSLVHRIGRKEGTYLFDQTTIVNTIHIYENAMVRRLSLRLNIAASATATEIIIIII